MQDKTIVCPKDGNVLDIENTVEHEIDFVNNKLELSVKTISCSLCNISWEIKTTAIGKLV